MRPADPVARLRRIADRAAVGDLGEDFDWLAAAVSTYLDRAVEGVDLDAAFGLAVEPGKRRWYTCDAKERRDHWIRTLAARHFQGMRARPAAMAIAQAARRYGASAWLRDRTATTMPTELAGTVREYLWRAMKEGEFPSERTIRAILSARLIGDWQ